MRARGHAAVETAAFNGQRERALHFLTSTHTARADDALGRIIGEIGIALVLRHPLGIDPAFGRARLDVVLALVAVAHVAQTDSTRHLLQFAVAIGGTGQTVERMVGDVELHHALADRLQALRLRVDDDAGGNRRRAGGRGAVAALDLDQTETAGAKGIDHIGRAEFRNLDPGLHGGAHDRGAFRDGDLAAIDGQRHQFFRAGRRSAKVDFRNEGHDNLQISHSAAASPRDRCSVQRHDFVSASVAATTALA
jgi:hypothetical protein